MTVVQELNALDTGVQRATERLLSLQHPDGWWKGELESNATMIAEHLFLLHFLGLRDAETDRLLANELLARRRADGTWSIWFEGPGDLSVTVEAYTALKLAGVDAGDATREYIRRGRRQTAPGAGSSRPGCGRWSCSPRSGTAQRTRPSRAASQAGSGSWCATATAFVPRPASPRSGTRRSPCSPSVRQGFPPTIRDCRPPARGCSARRSPSPATGRSDGPASRREAGRSSSTTTSTRTSTTRPSSPWRLRSSTCATTPCGARST